MSQRNNQTDFGRRDTFLLGAALIKSTLAIVHTQKNPCVFFPKLVRGDLKSPPDGWQTLLPSSMILSISFSSNITKYPPPLGIECVTSGSTVAGGQHFPMPLWSQNRDSFFPRGKNYATPSKIQ